MNQTTEMLKVIRNARINRRNVHIFLRDKPADDIVILDGCPEQMAPLTDHQLLDLVEQAHMDKDSLLILLHKMDCRGFVMVGRETDGTWPEEIAIDAPHNVRDVDEVILAMQAAINTFTKNVDRMERPLMPRRRRRYRRD